MTPECQCALGQAELVTGEGDVGAAAIAISAVLWLVERRRAGDGKRQNAVPSGLRDIMLGLLAVLKDARFRRMAPLSGSVVGAAFAIHGLWGASADRCRGGRG